MKVERAKLSSRWLTCKRIRCINICLNASRLMSHPQVWQDIACKDARNIQFNSSSGCAHAISGGEFSMARAAFAVMLLLFGFCCTPSGSE